MKLRQWGCKPLRAKEVYDNKIMKKTTMEESSKTVTMFMATPTDMAGFAKISKPANYYGMRKKP